MSHLTCTPTKPNLYFASSVATALSDTDTLTNLTFRVTNLKSAFHCFRTSKASVQVRGCVQLLVRCWVFTLRICYPTPNPQPGGPHPFSAVRYCSFSTFPAVFHIHRLRRRHSLLTGITCHAPSITRSRQYSCPFSCRSSGDLLGPVTLCCCEDHKFCSSYMCGLCYCPSTGSSLVTPNRIKTQRTIMFVLFSVACKAVTLGEEEWLRVTEHWRKQHNVELWLCRAHKILFGWSSEGG